MCPRPPNVTQEEWANRQARRRLAVEQALDGAMFIMGQYGCTLVEAMDMYHDYRAHLSFVGAP